MNFHVMADGEAPKELTDQEYPEWIWNLTKPEPTLAELKVGDSLRLSSLSYFCPKLVPHVSSLCYSYIESWVLAFVSRKQK